MNPAAPPAPADRLARLIEGLCGSVAARSAGGSLAGPLICLIWSRLRGLAGQFAGLAARFASGRLRRYPSRRPPRPGARRPARRPLPCSHAWLVRLVPQAAAAASQLSHLLAEPEMAALVTAAPQARRLLRPLCRMLGVRMPPGPKPAHSAAPTAPEPAAASVSGPPPLRAPPPLPPLPPLDACVPPVRA
ncbi:MAG: hypothetical protein ACLGP3_01200 [Acidobacteriota bacterium]